MISTHGKPIIQPLLIVEVSAVPKIGDARLGMSPSQSALQPVAVCSGGRGYYRFPL